VVVRGSPTGPLVPPHPPRVIVGVVTECSNDLTQGQDAFGQVLTKFAASYSVARTPGTVAPIAATSPLVGVGGDQGHPEQAAGCPVPKGHQPPGAVFG
jgi:hypothetical protein